MHINEKYLIYALLVIDSTFNLEWFKLNTLISTLTERVRYFHQAHARKNRSRVYKLLSTTLRINFKLINRVWLVFVTNLSKQSSV